MKERSFLVECQFCEIEVEIYCETEMTVDYCPFCGELLETDSDEDNWD